MVLPIRDSNTYSYILLRGFTCWCLLWLLAFGIEKMDGVGEYAGWRWIFILEGAATILIAATLPWTLPDSPFTASFLNAQDKELIGTRLEQDSGTSSGRVTNSETFEWKYRTVSNLHDSIPVPITNITGLVREALLEWKLYVATVTYWGSA